MKVSSFESLRTLGSNYIKPTVNGKLKAKLLLSLFINVNVTLFGIFKYTFTWLKKCKSVYSENAQHLALIFILLSIMASLASADMVNLQPGFYVLLT